MTYNLRLPILTLITAIALMQPAYSQHPVSNIKTITTSPDTTRLIDNINKIRDSIKAKMNTYRKFERQNDSTGECYDYIKGHELKLMTVHTKTKNTKGMIIDKKVEWYFDNKKEIYSELIWTDAASGNTVDDEKIYLNNGQLIAWFRAHDMIVNPESLEFKSMAKQVADYAKTLADHASKVK